MRPVTDWIEHVPAEWTISAIGHESWVRARLGWKGLTADEYVETDGVPMLATPNIKGAALDFSGANRISADRYDESPEIMLAIGDVLLTKDGSTIGTVNHVQLLPEPATVNGSIALITPYDRLHGRFLYWLIASHYAQSIFNRLRDGMGVPHLFQRDIKRIEFLRPPLAVQQAIAEYLDQETARIDTLIAKQEQLIETLRERRQQTIDDAFRREGPTRRLKHWLRAVDQGSSPQAEATPARAADECGVLKSGCVNHGFFRADENKLLPNGYVVNSSAVVRAGDLVVSRASGSPKLVGSAAMITKHAPTLMLSDKLFRLNPTNDSEARYLFWFLNSGQYRSQVMSAISGAEGLANNLPLRALVSFSVPLIDRSEQISTAAKLDTQTAKIDTLITKAERFIALSMERRAALITAAVTGQLEIPPELE